MSYLTHQACMARIEDLHRKAAAQRLANTGRVAASCRVLRPARPVENPAAAEAAPVGPTRRDPQDARAIVIARCGGLTWRNQ